MAKEQELELADQQTNPEYQRWQEQVLYVTVALIGVGIALSVCLVKLM